METLLKQLGLDDKEIKIYLAVQKQGKVRAAILARSLGLKRTTVYGVTKELVEKGLIKQDLGEPVLSFTATNPDEINQLVRKDEKILEVKKKVAAKVIEELEKLSKEKASLIPKIQFITQHKIEQHLYKQTALWAESIRKNDGTWWGFQDHTFVQHYEKWIDWSWESGVQKGINLKLISNVQEKVVKNKKFIDREIKFWQHAQNFTATLWVCGDHVINLVTNQKPHYLVEQLDPLLAKNLREVFKGIWKTNFI
jgi:sugar-specific transcriptional regulator TrmB